MHIDHKSVDGKDATPHNRLLLVDGLNVVRRIYEAVPGDDTPDKVTGVLTSSWGSIIRGIRENTPTHFMAAFDFGGETFRHRMFPGYKAHRAPMPQVLRDALPGFLERLNNAGLRTLRVPDVEADDTLATLSLKAVHRGFEVVLLSTDKDMLRLLNEGVRIRNHFKSEDIDEAYVVSRYGVSSRLMTDYLALMGDASDGIPGVKGVGEKTASKLLNIHGSLANVLDAAHSELDPIKGAMGDRLRAESEMARLSYALVALKLDVHMGITPNDLLLPAAMTEMLENMKDQQAPVKSTFGAPAYQASIIPPVPASPRRRSGP